MRRLAIVFVILSFVFVGGCVSTGTGTSPLPPVDPAVACAKAQKVVDAAKADVDEFCKEGLMNSDDCKTARLSYIGAKNALLIICP